MNIGLELQKIKDDINYIKKTITGNGEKGLIKTVELLRETIVNIQIVLVKHQSYNHLKNWILGGVITFLLAVLTGLVTYLRFRNVPN